MTEYTLHIYSGSMMHLGEGDLRGYKDHLEKTLPPNFGLSWNPTCGTNVVVSDEGEASEDDASDFFENFCNLKGIIK